MKKISFIMTALLLCAIFAPLSAAATTEGQRPLSGKIIGLDPGHQAKANRIKEPVGPGSKTMKNSVSSGTRGVNSRTWEHEINLQVGLKLRDLLVDAGATVIMTRETADVNIPNSERAKMMNEAGANLVLRIHCNGNSKERVNGTSMLVPSGKYCTAIEEESAKAGEAILASFIEATGSKDEGLRKRSDQTGFNWSTVPVCNIEMGYMTNEATDILLNTEEYQDICARALCDGIVDYFEPTISGGGCFALSGESRSET